MTPELQIMDGTELRDSDGDVMSQAVVTQLVGPSNTGLVMLVISVGVAVMRIITTQPINQK